MNQHSNNHTHDTLDLSDADVVDYSRRGKKKVILALLLGLSSWGGMFSMVVVPYGALFGLIPGVAGVILCVSARNDGYMGELTQYAYIISSVGALLNLVMFLSLFDNLLDALAASRRR